MQKKKFKQKNFNHKKQIKRKYHSTTTVFHLTKASKRMSPKAPPINKDSNIPSTVTLKYATTDP